MPRPYSTQFREPVAALVQDDRDLRVSHDKCALNQHHSLMSFSLF